MSQQDEPQESAAPAPEQPAPTPTLTPTPDPPAPPSGSDGERLSRVESGMANLTETLTTFIDAVTKGDITQEEKPAKKPWTHWGSK